MTLLVCGAGPNFVVLAADRRLTQRHGATYRIGEHEACKIVCYNGYSVWGYTGPAELDGKDTARWLTLTLADFPKNSFDLAVSHVAEQLAAPISRIPAPYRRMTVLAAGFMRFPSIDHLVPVVARISNFELPDGTHTRATNEFYETRSRLDGVDGVAFQLAGQNLLPEEKRRLLRSVGRPIRRGLHWSYMYPLLAQEIASIRRNVQIGDRVLVASIDKAAAERAYGGGDSYYTLGADFQYFGPASSKGEYFGPHFALTGGHALFDVKVGYA